MSLRHLFPAPLRATIVGLLATGLAAAPLAAYAQVVPTGGGPTIITAPNGVPVVNITAPNAAGVSRNSYTSYNVGTQGLVLNNGAGGALQNDSQLAGKVLANPNLGVAAKVILNEVTSANRSVLAGYTEVVGSAADVVVSNPYGITCSGCGFLNTPAATLTTGAAQFNASGGLTGFAVNGGDILITGSGVNATAIGYLALVSRQIKLEGQVNAKTADLSGGAQIWDYASRSAKAGTGSSAPQYAIDSTALGGIYAGKIRLIVTEAGVGVRMLGEAAASGSDFSIDAAGQIVVSAKVSAAQDVRIASATNLSLTDAQLSATRDIGLSTSGAAALAGGVLIAGRDLTASAAALSDRKTDTTVTDANKRYAARNLTFTVSGATTADQINWGAGSQLTVSAASFTTGASGTTLYSKGGLSLTTSGDQALGLASISATGDVSLAASGKISTLAGSGQGVQSTGGGVTVAAQNGFDNAGVVTADKGTLTARVSGVLNNTGQLHAGSGLTLGDYAGGASGSVANSGKIIADGALQVQAASLSNTSVGLLEGAASSAVTAESVTSAGSIILGTTAGSTSLLSGGRVSNTGKVQSAGGLTVASGSGGLVNTGGVILATGALTLQARDAAVTTFTNDATGLVQAGGVLAIQGYTGAANANLSNAGKMLGGTVALTVNTASNTGVIQSDGYLGAVFTDGLTNSGTVSASGDISVIAANTLTNASGGVLSASLGLKVRGTGALLTLIDAGRMQSGGLSDIAAGTGGLSMSLAGGGVFTTGSLNLLATGLTLNDGAKLTSQGATTLNLNTLTMNGPNAALIGANAGGQTSLTLVNPLYNNGLVYSGGDMTLTTPVLTNSTTGGLGAKGTFTVATPSLSGIIENSGALYAGTNLNLTAFRITNAEAGTLNSDLDARFTADTFINHNDINVARDLTIIANTFHNDVTQGDDRLWSYGGSGFNPRDPNSCAGGAGDYCGTSHPGLSGYHVNDYFDGECFFCAGHDDYSAGWTTFQYYASGHAPTHKPQVRANGSLTLRDFTTGTNIGGVISAPTIVISSAKAGAAFTNDDMSLTTQTWTATWGTYNTCDNFLCTSITTHDRRNFHKQIVGSTAVGFGAGIFAGSLTVTGVALSNTGSQVEVDDARIYNGGIAAPTTTAGGAQTTTTSSVSGTGTAATGVNATARGTFSGAIGFGGLNLNLPTNPNGYFVTVKDPTSAFLVETNPHFTSGDALGSDYLAKNLGIDPETIQRRLGDARYETYLIAQQVVAQTGNAVIARAETESQQVERLMDNAVDVAAANDLQWGLAPTPEQLARIDVDFVWMVETQVAGQKVLAPVVYLSAKTRSQVETGAVIAANDAVLDVTSLTNSGGTIVGSNSLTVSSKGDITNTSGTIKGGDVKIASTEGSIVNQDLAATGLQGSVRNKTASIQSTGDLTLDAAKDITVKGGQVNAGGDASLSAGRNVTFDTVAQTVTSTTAQTTAIPTPFGNLTAHGPVTQTTDTVNLKSGLTSGGALSVKSGKDITLAGTDVKARDASLNAAGDINLIAREDSHEKSVHENTRGGFLGGGSKTVTDKTITNVGSSLEVASLQTRSGGDTTIQGSDVTVAGNADIKTGGDLNILAGRNVTEHTEETSSSGIGQGGNLYGSKTHTVDDTHTRSVASNLNVGGNLNADVGKDLTVQGSNLNTKGDTTLAADSVQVLAGVNTDTHTDKTVETKLGIFLGADGQASAGGSKKIGKSSAGQASAQASGEVDIDLMRSETNITTTRDVTHTASNVATGGNLTVTARNDLRTVGSNLAAGGDVTLNAANQTFEAAQDSHEVTRSQEKTSSGLYVSGSGSAQAQGQYDAASKKDQEKGQKGGGSGSASAEGELQAGLRVARSSASETQGSTTARVSSITAGGNVNRNASGAITDVGTAIGAGGDLNQTAKTYNALAAQNTTYTSSSSESEVGKIGVSAQGSASGSGGGGGKSESGGSGSVGVAASFSMNKSDATTGTSQAVVTNIRTGGNTNLTSTDKTTLVGAAITSGGDTNITASALDIQAARNTQTAQSSGLSVDASARVGIVGSASVDVNAAVGTNSSTATNTQAVVGQLASGGALNLKTTQGDLRLEGTKIESKGDTSLDSAGSVKFDAAHDTAQAADQSLSVAVGISASKAKGGSKGGAFNAGVDVANSSSSEDNAVVGAVNTGGNLTVKSAKDTTFTGTALQVGRDATIQAGGDVNFNAAVSTQHSDSLDVGVGISASKTGGGKNAAGKEQQGEKSQGLSANVGVAKADARSMTGASFTTGGGFSIASGNDVNLQGTTLAAQGGGSINAARDVNATTIQDTASATNVGIGVAVDRSTTNKGTKDANGNAVGKSAQQKGSDKIASKANAKTGKAVDKAMAKNAKAAQAESASGLIAAAPDASQGAPDNAALDKIMDDKAAKDAKAAAAASPDGKAKSAATSAISDAASKAVKQKLADRKAKQAAEDAKSPEQKAEEAKAKKDAERAKMTPEERDKAEKKDIADQAKADKKAADAQAKAEKKAAADQVKADKKPVADNAKAEKKAAADQVKAEKKAASDAKKAEAAQLKADKKAADEAAKEAKMTPEQKAKSDAKKQAAADKKAATDAKKATADAAKAEKKAASDKAKAEKKAVSDQKAAEKKAKADEQESKTTVGLTQHDVSRSSETKVKSGSISGSGITITSGRSSNLSGTTVSQSPATPADDAAGHDSSGGGQTGKDLKSLTKVKKVTNAQAKKAITDKKAADAKKAADKKAEDSASKSAAQF